MPTVLLSFSAQPAHVRTARLVAVAVARRAGVAEELLEEVRLAIGEACSRAVALHRTHRLAELVEIAMEDGDRFRVRVVDRAANGLAMSSPPTDPALFLTEPSAGATGAPDSLNEEAMAARMGLALLAGLVDDLEVGGEVDVYTAPRLRERLVELVEAGARSVVVDLSRVEFLDSTGLGVLVGALKRLRAAGGSLALVCGQERLLKIFRITALDRVFSLYDTVEAATAAMGADQSA